MKIHLITDTHFFHTAMVKYCGRPENHTEIVGNNLLKANFTSDDVLIHLGDICIGHDDIAHEKYIQPLACKKWLVRGNHDHKSNHWYLTHGWDCVVDQIRITIFKKKLVFTHIPIRYDGTYDLNIHGHFHNDTHRSFEPALKAITDPHQKLLAIENTNYMYIPLEKFI